ncbi:MULTISPECIES: metallophosphoesterase [Rhodomicrobium]|uniref:metallophosphoesterase n=1 Tax=Rhodomicrobium TaxID=1068 RepID=UPI000B4B89A4|nr:MULTISPECIES: metallophosphoesterase [Rhodomicrobium]
MLTRRRFLQGAGGLVLLGASGSAYAGVIEPRFRLSLAEWTVAHPAWPAAAPPLRIVALADLHAMHPWMPVPRIESIVAEANALRPDLIVLLGDYVAGMQRFRTGIVPIADWTQALAALRAPLGVHAVLGNHDWWVDAKAVRRGLESSGIEVLENMAVKLSGDGRRFWLAGLGDQLAIPQARGFKGVDDLPTTIAQISGDTDPAILLAHEPDIFPRVPERVTLTLSGHTHGGQVLLPFIGRPAVPSRYGERFAYGHIVEGGRHLIVSAGLGLSCFPVRFMVPPEIALITLTAPGPGPA